MPGFNTKIADGAPGVLDCSYSEEWSDFREVFKSNAEQGFPHSEELHLGLLRYLKIS